MTMATQPTTTTSRNACATARRAYYRALARLAGRPASRSSDTPYTAYGRYLVVLSVYRLAAKWSLWETRKGVSAAAQAEAEADYAYAHLQATRYA